MGGFKASTLRRELVAGERDRLEVVRRELPRWKYSAGRVVSGLLNRRKETIELFCEGDYIPQWFMGHG